MTLFGVEQTLAVIAIPTKAQLQQLDVSSYGEGTLAYVLETSTFYSRQPTLNANGGSIVGSAGAGGWSLALASTSPVVMPAIPATPLVTFDASQASLIQRAGAAAPDGEFVDTWNTVAVQATTTLQPTYDLYALGGPCIWWGGHARPDIEPGPFVTALVAPSVAVSLPATFLVFGTFNNSLVNGTVHCWELGNTSSGMGVLFDALGSIEVVGPSGTLTGAVTWTITDNAQHDIAITVTGTTISVELDGVSLTVTPTGTAPGTGSITGNLTLGADHSVVDTTMWIGHCGFWGVWNRVLTSNEKAGWRAYLLLNWYRGSTVASLLHPHIQIGDSIAHGDQCNLTGNASPELAHGYHLTQYLGSTFGTFYNVSEGGARLTVGGSEGAELNVLSQWTNDALPLVTNGKDNVVRVQGGINDVAFLNPLSAPAAVTAAATISGYIATVINQVTSDLSGHASGPNGHVVIMTTMSAWTTSGSPFYEQCRTTVNATTIATYNNVLVNGVRVWVDQVCNDPVIGQNAFGRAGVDYPHFNYTTGPHPSQIGQNRWAGLQVNLYRRLGLAAGTLLAVTVTPSASALVLGGPKQYKAIATFTGSPPLDVTAFAVWDTSDHSIATIAAGGLLTPVANGSCSVTATFGGSIGSTTATVSTVTPATILGAGLAAWYRSDLGVTQSAGTATAYADQSDNAHNLAVLATQTAAPYATSGGINNRPYIVPTDNTAAALSTTTFSNAQPFEYILVMRVLNVAPGGGRYAIDFSAPPGGANDCALLQAASQATIQLYPGPSTSALAVGEHWLDCQCNGASSSIAVDGGSPATGTVSASPSGITLFNVGVSSPTQSMNHFHYELIVGTGIFTGPQRTALLAYINALYT